MHARNAPRTAHGRGAPVVALPPSWLSGAAVGQWVQITGTELTGSAGDLEGKSVQTIGAYNGMAFNESTGEIVLLANGGHGDSSVNAVQSININQDAPAWVLRTAATPSISRVTTGPGVGYNSDGLPRSRHTYYSSQWISQRARYMNFAARFMASDASSAATVDGWDPATNLWDASGTFGSILGWGAGTCKNPATGDVYTCGNYYYFYKWTQATDTWSQSASGLTVYGPLLYDSSRNIVVSFSYEDNVNGGGGVVSIVTCNDDLSNKRSITINASAAYSDWQASTPYTPAFVYDPVADHYLIYTGISGATQKVWVVTPNAGTTWDMSFLSTTGVTPAAVYGVSAAGANNKFAYFPTLGGCVLLAQAGSPIYFLRLS